MKRAITDAYATMTSLTATTTAARNWTTNITQTTKEEIAARDIYIDFSRKSNTHVKSPSAHSVNLDMHVPF